MFQNFASIVLAAVALYFPGWAGAAELSYPAPPAFVKPRVVLITSLDTRIETLQAAISDRHPLKGLLGALDPGYFDRYVANLEAMFRKYFDPAAPLRAGPARFDVGIHVLRRANLDDIARVLQGGENVAVIYVAHAGFSASGVTITDYWLNDIKVAFRKVHPNLRYLGLVGCSNKRIVEALKSEGYFADTHRLELFATDGLADAGRGLTQAMDRAAEALVDAARDGRRFVRCDERPYAKTGFELRIVRTIPAGSVATGAAAVWMRGELLATFGPAPRGAVQEKVVWFEAKAGASRAELKLIVTGAGEPGLFEFLPQWPRITRDSPWRRVELDGVPVGTSSRVYRFEGEPPSLVHAGAYAGFACVEQQDVRILGWNDGRAVTR